MHEHIIHSADDCPPPGGYCRTHELNLLLLAALYAVSRVLSRSLDFNESLRDVLRVLHDEAGLTRGLISVVDPDSGKLNIHTIYTPEGPILDDAQYGPGEGIIGLVLEKPRTIKLVRVADEPRFLNRQQVYDLELPFIAVPIKVGGDLKGVLAVQPEAPEDGLLEERAQFVEMVANLIGQSLRLALEVAQEKIDAGRRARPAAPHRPPPVRLRQHGRPLGGDAPGFRPGAPGRQVEHHRADPRRNRHRQGTDRQRHPLQLAARAQRDRPPQLRGAAGKPARIRTLRPRARRLHRRRRIAQGALRAGARRHAVPRRNRRSLAALPGQAAARPAGRRIRARRRQQDDQGRRAHHRRHPPRSGNRRRHGRLPRGSVLPPERHADLPAAAARADRGHPGNRPPPADQDRQRPETQAEPDRHGAAPAGQSSNGRATCANWKTAWSAPPCSPKTARSMST